MKRFAADKDRSSLYKKSLTMDIVFALLIVCVYIVSNDTLSWFSNSKTVQGGNAGIRIDSMNIQTAYGVGIENGGFVSCDTWYDSVEEAFYQTESADETGEVVTSMFSNMRPGEQVYLAVRYTNLDASVYKADVFLTPGSEVCETYEESGQATQYAYYGSQLRVGKVTVISTDQNQNSTTTDFTLNNYLLSNPTGASYFAQEVTDIPATQVASELILLPNGSLTIYIEVEFVDNGQDQNLYQRFGKKGGSCSRYISADFERTG